MKGGSGRNRKGVAKSLPFELREYVNLAKGEGGGDGESSVLELRAGFGVCEQVGCMRDLGVAGCLSEAS